MKIDIITRHAVANYGSLLQSYATQKSLEKMGLDVEFINYIRYDERGENLAETHIKGKKWDNNFLTRFAYKSIQTYNYSKMFKKFEKFRNGFINETDKKYGNIEELKKQPPSADIYCTGSDQIWGKVGKENYDPAYFLEFAKNQKCISYAASFGKEKLEEELSKDLPKLLNKYSTIFVRENSAVDIVKKAGFTNVKQVLDPTMLLEKKDWENLIFKKPKEKNYVLVYQLHNNKEFNKYAKEFAKYHHKKLVRISTSLYHIVRGGKFIYLPTQYEFLSYFANADYILTDSFHATVFSIIFNKKFKDILPKDTSTRILSILELVGLQDRVLQSYDDFKSIDENIDYDKVNSIINKERIQSLRDLSEAIGEREKNIYSIGIHKRCTGCRACEQLCPKNAIEIIENEEGFFEPKINKEKCINCGICLKSCPQGNKNIVTNMPIVAYAAKNKDIEQLKKGSSGSIFRIIANYVLEKNGVVYGVALNEKFEAEMIRVDKKEDLAKVMGSKYVQSNTLNTFLLAKKDLENNKIVLYTGTSCQIGGLKEFLNKGYKNLITIDLICHGVPSPKLFQNYIGWLEKSNKSKVKNINFRNKENSDTGKIKVEFKNRKYITIEPRLSPYYQSYIDGKVSREACYECKYASYKRIGDITLGDYWGVEKVHKNFNSDMGVSAILINTKTGQELFDEVKDNIEYIKTDIDKIARFNCNLCKPTYRPNVRTKIYKNLGKIDFILYSKKYLKYKKEPKILLKNITPLKIRRQLKGKLNGGN